MKISASILLILMPIAVFAQNYQRMSEEDMQNMMRRMEKMKTCMQNIDEAKMKVLEKHSRRFEAEVELLCAKGKRDEAQEKAVSFGQEMVKDPTMQTMRRCGEMMSGVMPMPQMPFIGQHKDYSVRHVCD